MNTENEKLKEEVAELRRELAELRAEMEEAREAAAANGADGDVFAAVRAAPGGAMNVSRGGGGVFGVDEPSHFWEHQDEESPDDEDEDEGAESGEDDEEALALREAYGVGEEVVLGAIDAEDAWRWREVTVVDGRAVLVGPSRPFSPDVHIGFIRSASGNGLYTAYYVDEAGREVSGRLVFPELAFQQELPAGAGVLMHRSLLVVTGGNEA